MDVTLRSQNDGGAHCRRKLRIVDHTLDDAELDIRCPLDNGKHVIQGKRPVGQLDHLPVELLGQVLGMLDIPTLTAFRRVNQRAMHLVDSLPPYRRLWAHCPNVLRAVVSINAASFSCEALGEILTTREKCEYCLACFGGYLYLITCQRVCYFCFTTRKEYFPVTLTLAVRHTKLQKKALGHLPRVLSLPGRYTAFEKLSRHRVTLIDRQALLPLMSEANAKTLNGRIDYTTTEPRRYMSIVRAPRINLCDQTAADWAMSPSTWTAGTNIRNKVQQRQPSDAPLPVGTRRISSFPGSTICPIHICEDGSKGSRTTLSHMMLVPSNSAHCLNSSFLVHPQV